jgi:hypothetical protein
MRSSGSRPVSAGLVAQCCPRAGPSGERTLAQARDAIIGARLSADRDKITELIADVARSEVDTYDRAREVWSQSFGAVGGEDWIYHPLWLLWGVLTDWVEVKPQERTKPRRRCERQRRPSCLSPGTTMR